VSEPAERPLRFSPYRLALVQGGVALFGLWVLVFMPLTALPVPALELAWQELPHGVRGGVRLLAIVAACLLLSGWFFRVAAVVLGAGLAWLASYGRVDVALAGQAALLCLAVATFPGRRAFRIGAIGEPSLTTGPGLRAWSIGVYVASVGALVWVVLSLSESFGFTRFGGSLVALASWALLAFDERWLPPVGDHEAVVYFDGVCAFCQGSVQMIMAEEARPWMRFAPLQGTTASERLGNVSQGPHGSIVFSSGGQTFVGSDAALRVARAMGGYWRLWFVIRVVPRGLRNRFYDWFAANRYRWFGRTESCFLPSPEQRSRFLP
jgi:predicted DCC family thiol-disulfide oxidoreductase YuxK